MTATLDDEVVDLRRANAELQRRLNEALAERDESLRRETATAEVLGVINSSPGDLAPVFDAMLDKAIRLCEATHGHIFNYDGERFDLATVRGEPQYIEWARQAGPVQPYPSSPLGRIKHGEQIVHVVDIQEEEVYRAVPIFRESGRACDSITFSPKTSSRFRVFGPSDRLKTFG